MSEKAQNNCLSNTISTVSTAARSVGLKLQNIPLLKLTSYSTCKHADLLPKLAKHMYCIA